MQFGGRESGAAGASNGSEDVAALVATRAAEIAARDGGEMTFFDTAARAKAHLHEHGRVSLRALSREFALDDDALEELIEELVEIQQVAARDGKALAWIGATTASHAEAELPASPPERNPRAYTPKHLADKILQSKSALEGERKQVTVLFADVKGSMELAEQLDPEAFSQIMSRFFQILSEGVERFEALDDLCEFRVKDVTDPVHVHRLTGIGPSRTRFDISRARGLSRFVGRAADLRMLEDAVAQTAAGNGQVVGVVAEAGTGKSRLCFEVLEGCRARGMHVYEGRAVAHGRNIHLAAGRVADAIDAARSTLDLMGRVEKFQAGMAAALLAEALLQAGDSAAALSAAEEAIALCRRSERGNYEATAHGVLARALLRRDGAAARDAALANAAELIERSGATTLAPALCEWRAELAGVLGDDAARVQLLGQAQQGYEAIGAPGHAERVVGLLAGAPR